MSPRAVVISVLALTTCLVLALMMLGMLSAQEPSESAAGEMLAPSSGQSCDGTAPAKRVVLPPSGAARVFQC